MERQKSAKVCCQFQKKKKFPRAYACLRISSIQYTSPQYSFTGKSFGFFSVFPSFVVLVFIPFSFVSCSVNLKTSNHLVLLPTTSRHNLVSGLDEVIGERLDGLCRVASDSVLAVVSDEDGLCCLDDDDASLALFLGRKKTISKLEHARLGKGMPEQCGRLNFGRQRLRHHKGIEIVHTWRP